MIMGWEIGAAAWAAFRASRVLQIATAVLAAWLGWQGWVVSHDHKVSTRVAQQIGHANEAVAKKGADARRTVDPDGSLERLRARYCPDCGSGK